jgi:threonine/homoserine/homoserine lactone efflux protein
LHRVSTLRQWAFSTGVLTNLLNPKVGGGMFIAFGVGLALQSRRA